MRRQLLSISGIDIGIILLPFGATPVPSCPSFVRLVVFFTTRREMLLVESWGSGITKGKSEAAVNTAEGHDDDHDDDDDYLAVNTAVKHKKKGTLKLDQQAAGCWRWRWNCMWSALHVLLWLLSALHVLL